MWRLSKKKFHTTRRYWSASVQCRHSRHFTLRTQTSTLGIPILVFNMLVSQWSGYSEIVSVGGMHMAYASRCHTLWCIKPMHSRYVEVHSPALSCMWLFTGAMIVTLNFMVIIAQHGYTVNENPQVDVAFWYVSLRKTQEQINCRSPQMIRTTLACRQDYSTDNTWLPRTTGQNETSPPYCNSSFWYSSEWGSDNIKCEPPKGSGLQFYHTINELKIATSIAYGKDPLWASSSLAYYESIEQATVVCGCVSFWFEYGATSPSHRSFLRRTSATLAI